MPGVVISEIEGFTPLLDPRRIKGAVVVDGRNYLIDANGPVSSLARSVIAENLFAAEWARGIQSIRQDEQAETRYFTRDGISQFDPVTKQLVREVTFTTPFTDSWPWSSAIVGGIEYYTRRGGNLYSRTPTTGVWARVTTTQPPISITQSAGRLIVLSVGLVEWSAIDDGSDFVGSTVTGAGFQALSMLSVSTADECLAVLEIERGFIVYTTRGLVRFQTQQAIIPFRWDVLSRHDRPINAWSIVSFGDYSHLFLDARGFHRTSGDAPEIWNPLLSEYFHQTILPATALQKPTIIRLDVSADSDWVLISRADIGEPELYTSTFIHYQPSNKVGQFNKPHRGFIDVQFNESSGFFETGYIDVNGTMWDFTGGSFDQVPPVDFGVSQIVNWKPPREWLPIQVALDTPVTNFTDRAQMTDEGAGVFEINAAGYWNLRHVHDVLPSPVGEWTIYDFLPAPVVAGNTTTFGSSVQSVAIGTSVRVTAADINPQPLDSIVRIGVFRGSAGITIDELAHMTRVGVGTLEGQVSDVFEDWMLDYPTVDVSEDWQLIPEGTQDEDWGFGNVAYAEFTLYTEGTLDGKTVIQGQRKIGLVQLDSGELKQFSTDVIGLYHVIEISTPNIGDTYHIKQLELDFSSAGRLL